MRPRKGGHMSRDEPVYEEWEATLVPSSHADGTYYRVFWGAVNWSGVAGDMHKAVTVFMQYGATRDWSAARTANEIALKMPAHILSEDLTTVLPVMAKYQGK